MHGFMNIKLHFVIVFLLLLVMLLICFAPKLVTWTVLVMYITATHSACLLL